MYTYDVYFFERPFYLVTWTILVFLVTFVNVLVVTALSTKGMRTPTNMILTFIAIADLLTGLITLPSYFVVYELFLRQSNENSYNKTATIQRLDHTYANNSFLSCKNESNFSFVLSTDDEFKSQNKFVLTKDLCRFLLISKFFLSRFFHTVSIFLTLFLAIQRFISVAFPVGYKLHMTMKRTAIVCISIVLLSPIIHIFYLSEIMAPLNEVCAWQMYGCSTGCAYLWFIIFIRHLIPCFALSLFTVFFLRKLRESHSASITLDKRRANENRRITTIVLSIVAIFLVPEVPYGIFLLVSVVKAHKHLTLGLTANRVIPVVYDFLQVLLFHSIFCICTIFNTRFRNVLRKVLCCKKNDRQPEM